MSKVARERIERLLEKAAERKREKGESLSSRYVELARKISERTQTRIPEKFQRKFCRNCNDILIASNVEVRVKADKLLRSCRNCGHKEEHRINN